MTRTTRILLAATVVAGVGLGTFGLAAATASPATQDQVDDDGTNEVDDAPLAGADAERAISAALEHTGGGEVLETEVGDDGAAFEVEIRLADGSEVEVNLDADFAVTGSEPDDD